METHVQRLDIEKSMKENMMLMVGGNPGSMVALVDMVNSTIDVDAEGMRGLSHLMNLDSLGIYDDKIWHLYSDICKRDVNSAVTLLRASQLGLIDRTLLVEACSRPDRTGAEMFNIPNIYKLVKEYLPNYGPLK